MCGRYTLTITGSMLADWFGIAEGELDLVPRYNIAPTQEVLTVISDGQRNHARPMRWGLIPSWAKDISIGSRMINARAETLAEKPSFRTALRKRRCLVPADGFYEWQQTGGRKRPMRIVLRSREPFAFAGLWDTWRSPEGEAITSCTIVTTSANSLMEPIHSRMPVILPRENEAAWLAPDNEDVQALCGLLLPYPSERLEAYEVSGLVNSPRNETSQCIAPARATL